jgi:hypothetical protein
MKDLPHHIKKLNRRVIRSVHREEGAEELPDIPPRPPTERAKKKKAKQKVKSERLARTPSGPTPEERNKVMKGGRQGRVPIFDRNSAAPKHAPPSKKKRPKI